MTSSMFTYASPLCFLCNHPVEKLPCQGSLDKKWSKDSSSALCQLLYLEPTVFTPMLLNSSYCNSCYDNVNDAVMLLRSLASIEKQVTEVRLKIAKTLLNNLESEDETDSAVNQFCEKLPSRESPVKIFGSTEAESTATIEPTQNDPKSPDAAPVSDLIAEVPASNIIPPVHTSTGDATAVSSSTNQSNHKKSKKPRSPSLGRGKISLSCRQISNKKLQPTSNANQSVLKRRKMISVAPKPPLLRTHLKHGRHSEIEKLRQPYCREKECSSRPPFSSYAVLEEHMRSHQLYRCESCKRELRGRIQLSIHLRTKEHKENPPGKVLQVFCN